jgi:hypothetical protein
MTRLALATENNPVDGEILLRLVGRLGIQPKPWATSVRPFTGWQGIFKELPIFLELARRDGVQRALICIDNDGGARRHPAHQEDHDRVAEAQNGKAGCRTCRMLERLPEVWRAAPLEACVVVPVQAIETWLLALRNHAFANSTPENNYDRNALKKQFWADDLHAGDKRRLAVADAVLERADALVVLRKRPSFAAFENQVAGWR